MIATKIRVNAKRMAWRWVVSHGSGFYTRHGCVRLRPGRWTESVEPVPCSQGWHCSPKLHSVAFWLAGAAYSEESARLALVEVGGKLVRDGHRDSDSVKWCSERVRIVAVLPRSANELPRQVRFGYSSERSEAREKMRDLLANRKLPPGCGAFLKRWRSW